MGCQIWAGFQIESPLYGNGYEAVDGVFDVAATYKKGSDIFLPYGEFHPTGQNASFKDIQSLLLT